MPLQSEISADLKTETVTIANGASLSGGVDMKAHRLHRINIPAGWTAAGLTFQASDDGETWYNLYDLEGEYEIPSAAVGASRSIIVDFQKFWGIRHLKVRSGTSGAAVNQGAERVIVLSLIPR